MSTFWQNVNEALGAGTVGAALSGVVTAIITHRLSKRKYNAEVDGVIMDSVKKLVDMMTDSATDEKERREKCECEMDKMREELGELRAKVAQLENRSIIQN